MRYRWLLIITVLLFSMLGLSDDKKSDSTTDLSLVVTKQTNGKPVRNATIVIHTIDKDGNLSSGGINLKTDGDGKTEFRGLPSGKVRVQVIAKGFQTFGEDYDVTEPTKTIEIKLNPPKEQYSIYK